MAHELEMKNGQARMMYAGKAPWHGLGQHVETEVTAGAAIRLADLDWKLEKQPIYIEGTQKIDDIPVVGVKVPDKVAVVRPEDNSILGVVSDRYEIIQNADCFDFMDEIIGSGQAVYHTAGSIFDGKRIFMTVKLPGDAMVGDDKIEKYILLTTSHDGSLALNIRWTPIRVVCNNTMNAALSRTAKAGINIRHTTNYKARVSEARKVLEMTDHYYQVMEQEFNRLLDAQFTEGEMVNLTEQLFPTKVDDNGKVKLSTNTKNRREKMVGLFHNGIGVAPIKNTRWAAFNAVTEFVDHHRSTAVHGGRNKKDLRFNASIFGGGAQMKQKAFDLLKV